ncbi:hypothetical protein AB0B50_39710 [Streptomyces sp. NPDC041068]|uniref:hypothetical protein n=1 Tax=Streptomyces sp. NPDC041068 TaxID=3155130 RepID=UPI003407C573
MNHHRPGDLYRRWPTRDVPNIVILRIAGLRMSPSGGRRWVRRQTLVFALACLGPALLAAVAIATGLTHKRDVLSHFGWTAFFVGLDVIAVAVHWWVCRLFLAVSEDLDAILTPPGRTAVHSWIDAKTSRGRQVRAMVIGGVLLAGGLLTADTLAADGVRGGDGDSLFVAVTSYATVTWSGVLYGSSGYWLLNGGRMATVVSRRGNVKLLWSAPARTPGMEKMSSAYRLASLMVSLGTAAGLVPVLSWAYSGPQDTSVSVVKWSVIASTLVMAAVFSLLPQLHLSMAIGEAKSESLRKISALLPDDVPTHQVPVDEQTARNIELLAMVASSPSSTITGQTVASVILALMGATVPALAQVIF